jgi:uncharacterized membrane protein YagU involved in acid resistance
MRPSWLLWSFGATIVLTTLLAMSQSSRLTRMNIPYMLGTMFTGHRDRAKIYGFLVHVVNGFVFALIYVAAFRAWGGATIVRGVTIGLVHAFFVLAVGLPMLPGMHPRMASETSGPSALRQLEPPGFFGLHYGWPTPVSVIASHVAFGAILGAFVDAS